MRRAWPILILFCVALSGTRLAAQWQVTTDVGVARLRQTDIPEANAPTFGVTASVLGDRWGLGSNILSARSSASRWTTQGVGVASLRSDAGAVHQWELTGFGSSFSASNEASTLASELMAQARFGTRDAGESVGLGAGVLAHYGTASLGQLQADAWRSVGKDRFRGEGSVTATRSAVYEPNGSIGLAPLSYADLSASWRREYSGLSYGATGGLRAGIDNAPALDSWASVDAEAWLAPHAAVVASVGTTLADAVRGVPRTRFVSLAIRLAVQPRPTVVHLGRRADAGVRVSVEVLGDGTRRIEVRGASGARVELMADFTNWNPVALDRSGDGWSTVQRVSPGLHRMALRIDGGEWTAPANVRQVTDDLGGVVGLITIP
ncbi:MAG: glycogen-binding domain-containing protein [Gemmatimonadaceae bacterium]